MDKLVKVPPKGLQRLKDNPIAQGIVSNALFQVGWGGGSAMIAWVIAHYALIAGIPPYAAMFFGVVAFFLLALSVNLLRRRKDARALSAAPSAELQPAPDNPTIEILSPFDHDEVGLYEIVRGRVSPPDQKLQAAVFSGDRQWHPQSSPVSVTGSTWSVKCQFGDRDNPRKGSYKVVVLLGNDLKRPITELPPQTVKSNIITVHKPEDATEHKLAAALSECEKYKTQLSSARADAEANKAERTGILIEKNMLADQVKELQEAIGLANQKLIAEEINSGNWVKACNKAERELAELKWLADRMKKQGQNLDNWVRIERVKSMTLHLFASPRMIVLAFWVHNASIFDITFDFDHVKGCLHFKNRPLNDPIRVPPSKVLDIVRPDGGMEIVLEQPLLATEAETISDAQKLGDPNGIFWLGNLNIPIMTVGSPQSFNGHKLRIHSEIELQYITDFPCDK